MRALLSPTSRFVVALRLATSPCPHHLPAAFPSGKYHRVLFHGVGDHDVERANGRGRRGEGRDNRGLRFGHSPSADTPLAKRAIEVVDRLTKAGNTGGRQRQPEEATDAPNAPTPNTESVAVLATIAHNAW